MTGEQRSNNKKSMDNCRCGPMEGSRGQRSSNKNSIDNCRCGPMTGEQRGSKKNSMDNCRCGPMTGEQRSSNEIVKRMKRVKFLQILHETFIYT
jgi:hypothetical protein